MRQQLAAQGVRSTDTLTCSNGSMLPMSSLLAHLAGLRIYNDDFGSG